MESQPLISAEYQALQRQLHAENDGYGSAALGFAPIIAEVVRANNVRSLLDYGAGKGRLAQELDKIFNPPLQISCYEPAIPEWAKAPLPAEMVACIDVLEHIEPEYVDAVLDDLRRVTLRLAVLTIDTLPATKTLADGRNAHLIQKPAAWWLPHFMSRFDLVHFGKLPRGFWVILTPLLR